MSDIKFTPRPRFKVPASKLEALYNAWIESQSISDYDKMLTAVLDTVYAHNLFLKHDDADIVASNAAVRIARALPGYAGKPLKLFDRSKGSFSSFVSRVGKSAMRDFLKQKTPAHAGDANLAFPADSADSTAEETTEYFDWANDDPWHSDGRSHSQKTPDYDEVADPKSRATMGESCWSGPDYAE